MMELIIGTAIALIVLILVAWVGYKKFRRPIPWLIVLPIVSIVHTFLGWHILALAYEYDSLANPLPLFASILAPTYFAVNMIGIPLEVVGVSDNIAYSFAYGLNAILLTTVVILVVQWIMKKIHGRNA